MAERTGLSLSSLVTAAVERGLPEVIHDLARLRAAPFADLQIEHA